MGGLQDPRLHTFVSDGVPDAHPLAWEMVRCDATGCAEVLHAGNNECMQEWVETGVGNFCLPHFVALLDTDQRDEIGLPDPLPWEQGA